MRLLAKFLENLTFFANFSIFLTLAVFPASWNPFFWIPQEFLGGYSLFHWIFSLEMTCSGANMSKKNGEKSYHHHHPHKVASNDMALSGIQTGNDLWCLPAFLGHIYTQETPCWASGSSGSHEDDVYCGPEIT